MAVRMRFRTDCITTAEQAAKLARGEAIEPCTCGEPDCPYDRAAIERTPPAAPGDTWRLTHYRAEGDGPVAGYAICCPRCQGVHYWSSANNCASRRPAEGGGTRCDHTGVSSCWTWTGSAEEGTLSGYASLFVNHEGGCGFHGWLKDGVLAE